MAQKKIFTTDGPLMADEVTGAALVEAIGHAPLAVSLAGAAGSGAYVSIGDGIELGGAYMELGMTIRNASQTAGQDLTGFKFRRKTHADGPWQDVLIDSDLEALSDTLRESLIDHERNGHYVYQLAAGDGVAGEFCQLRLNVRGAYAVDFQAKAAASTPALTIVGTATAR